MVCECPQAGSGQGPGPLRAGLAATHSRCALCPASPAGPQLRGRLAPGRHALPPSRCLSSEPRSRPVSECPAPSPAPLQCCSEREVRLGKRAAPGRLPGFRWPRSGPCGLWSYPTEVHAPLCGRKRSECNRAQVHTLLLLGPQFPQVRTQGVCRLVVMNVSGVGSVATGGRTEPGDPGALPDHKRGWST